MQGEEPECFHQAQTEASSDIQAECVGQELLSAISGSFQLSHQILDVEQGKAETTATLTEIFRNSINDRY